MRLSSSQLIGLAVETTTGVSLGVVKALHVEAATQHVVQYEVGPHLVPSMLARTLLVGANQVIELTDQKMIVEDAVLASSAAPSLAQD